MTQVKIDRLVTSGTFNLDGGSWDVDNNVWLIGDETQVLVVDAAHDADAIVRAVGGREVLGVVCTHAHDDHVNAAPELARRLGARLWLHPADLVLWQQRHPEDRPSDELSDGQKFTVGDQSLVVLHTPGHSPGSVCLYGPGLGAVFTGDTLFQGGPGATGRSYSDRDLILDSICARLLSLPGSTAVHTGHGASTTISDETANCAA
jgi:glyoxylase-like metal-dependent hydrolase (beta-lactamase superfamily II)